MKRYPKSEKYDPAWVAENWMGIPMTKSLWSL